MDPARELLRHTVATVAYRGGKSVRGAPATFAGFRIGETTRTPAQILAHVGDLFDWAPRENAVDHRARGNEGDDPPRTAASHGCDWHDVLLSGNHAEIARWRDNAGRPADEPKSGNA